MKRVRGEDTGRERVGGLQTQKKRDEKERGKGSGGGMRRCTKTRHCVAQLAGRDEGEKYPEGGIQCGAAGGIVGSKGEQGGIAKEKKISGYDVLPLRSTNYLSRD